MKFGDHLESLRVTQVKGIYDYKRFTVSRRQIINSYRALCSCGSIERAILLCGCFNN
jgi:hypothetical protein